MLNKIIDLNESFNAHFYKKFTFILDNKIIKSGRLKLFSMKGFNLKFFLTDEDNLKPLELSYPFELVETENGYKFDYRLKKFKTLKDTEQLQNLSESDISKSRFYDKLLLIKIE